MEGKFNVNKLRKIKETPSQAYETWTKKEEELLIKYSLEGKSINEISSLLRRQPRGIKSGLRRIINRLIKKK